MRIRELELVAFEESNYTILFTFKDEAGEAVTPNSINWWLSSLDGAIINSRANVSVDTPSASWYLTLSGDDLQILNKDADIEKRYVTVKAFYDSDRGLNLPLTTAVIFGVKNLRLIAPDLNINAIDMIFTDDAVGGVE